MTPFLRTTLLLFTFCLLGGVLHAQPTDTPPAWPEVTETNKPWSRWWWHGSAVEPAELAAALAAYAESGLGGLEITPIYGVAGYEDRFVDFLSEEWMQRLVHSLREADRLGLGIDMATGTGWPFGGPWVDAADASKYLALATYSVPGGTRLDEPVVYRQEPFVRAVGNTLGLPTTDALVEPIAANPNLQALAIDQVRFDKRLPLLALTAYGPDGRTRDLTDRVGADGRLDWSAPRGESWTLVAAFQGWHGKMVERAAPGGEGNVIDHFSEPAIRHYLHRFDSAFAGHDLSGLRAFFNDSYEVDDARGEADWTPDFFEAFEERRGYDLRDRLDALAGHADEDTAARVRSDYRATIGELILERFTTVWRDWAHARGALVRNQAHGSPANILDLYAASDIPETEGTELLRIKFASSAGNVTGRPLVSAEAATWLDEHFRSSLADIKASVDRYLIGGVNHVVYHGTTYSPRDEPWPGRLFYAAVHLTQANPLWTDFDALNLYVARAQAFLQAGRPDNDVLLYFPIYDLYAASGRARIEHVDGIVPAFDGSAFRSAAETLLERGFAFDFVSDRQFTEARVEDGRLATGVLPARYRTVVAPESRFIPLDTFARLIDAAREGATVVFYPDLPHGVPGLADLDDRRDRFREAIESLAFVDAETAGVREAAIGAGRALVGADLPALLRHAGVRREAMIEDGLQFVRRRHDDGTTYFILNAGDAAVDGWVPLATAARSAWLYEPMHGATGAARLRPAATGSEVHLQLDPGAAALVRTFDTDRPARPFPYVRSTGATDTLSGPWTVRFLSGGPTLPPEVATAGPASWTTFDADGVEAFSGTAAYTTTFAAPGGKADAWLLDLGRVHESAVVRLNGQDLAKLIGPTFRLVVDADRIQPENTLEVHVTNGMANRIADLDRRGVVWKKFYNVNMAARLAENRNEQGLFAASGWAPMPAGVLGPVTLTPVGVADE